MNFVLNEALSWCPWKSNILASGGGTADRTIRIWNCQNGTNLYTIDAKSQVMPTVEYFDFIFIIKSKLFEKVSAILWSKHYKELISSHGYSNNELIIWKYPGLAKIAELTGISHEYVIK